MKLVLFLPSFIMALQSGYAQPRFGDVYVMGEHDSPAHAQCKISYSSAIAAAQAELRENRIPISYHHILGRTRAYLNIDPIVAGAVCTVSYEIRFDFFLEACSFPGQIR